MTERAVHQIVSILWLALGLVMLPVLLKRTAPYGRHTPPRPGPTVKSRTGWLVMEAPAALVFAACVALGRPTAVTPWVLFALWELHYVHRAFIYPFRMRGGDKPMPVGIAAAAFFFTTVNGYLNGRAVGAFAARGDAWLYDPRFLVGAALFLVGFAINQHADLVLLKLRRPGETGYKVPHGGLYRFVTCPNYFGEILAWIGWAVASWTVAGAAFAAWTIGNLLPRALAHHRWYRQTFADYPPERKALIPGLL